VVARLNVWLWPLVGLATWCAVASAAWGKTIVWRGIHYSMDSANSTRVLHHAGQTPPASAPPAIGPVPYSNLVASSSARRAA
jgi:hypothetical protein